MCLVCLIQYHPSEILQQHGVVRVSLVAFYCWAAFHQITVLCLSSEQTTDLSSPLYFSVGHNIWHPQPKGGEGFLVYVFRSSVLIWSGHSGRTWAEEAAHIMTDKKQRLGRGEGKQDVLLLVTPSNRLFLSDSTSYQQSSYRGPRIQSSYTPLRLWGPCEM